MEAPSTPGPSPSTAPRSSPFSWRFWEHDRSLSVLQALLALHVFVVIPLRAAYQSVGPLQEVVFTLLLVTGAIELKGSKLLRAVAFFVVAAESALRIGRAATFGMPPAIASEAVDVALLAGLAVIVLLHAMKPGPITAHRLVGACSAYMLLGLAWAHAYELVGMIAPDAFRGDIVLDRVSSSYVYFSFVTLTTAGYGDIVPVSPAARALATAEALTGQLYPALLLGRMVALHVEWQGRRSSQG